MSHITIVISRAQPSATNVAADSPAANQEGINYASVSYTPSDLATDEEVTRMCHKLYKQVKELGE